MLFRIYKLFSIFFSPLIFIFLLYRAAIGKEVLARLPEKFGYSSVKKNIDQKTIWFHAASVGEALSILNIINHYSSKYPDHIIIVTSITTSSAKILKDRLPHNAIHQFLPIDSYFPIKRFLQYWKPTIILWTESEFWPCIIAEAAKFTPIILLNGRISDQSYTKWQKYPNFIKSVLSHFKYILAQSSEDMNRFIKLGAANVSYIGNLKYCKNNHNNINDTEYNALKKKLKNKIVIVAASTHHNEEHIIGLSYLELKKNFNNLILIIAPRHPHRTKDIINSLSQTLLSVQVRSECKEIKANTDIYIVNTLGELDLFYKLSQLVIMGGSFIPHGGQNIIEPARYNNAIIVGPYMNNFREIMNNFLETEAVIQLNNYQEIAPCINNILSNLDLKKSLIQNALNVSKKNDLILNKTIKIIDEFWPLERN